MNQRRVSVKSIYTSIGDLKLTIASEDFMARVSEFRAILGMVNSSELMVCFMVFKRVYTIKESSI